MARVNSIVYRYVAGKRCSKCLADKSSLAFGINRTHVSGLESWCRQCTRPVLAKRQRDKNLTPAERFQRRLWTGYRLTVESYAWMLYRQDFRCPMCERSRPLEIDHDHACCPGLRSCGKCVRGLLCKPCNMGIGVLEESLTTLRNAIVYLGG